MTEEQINIAIAEICGWKYEKNETHAPDGAFWWSKKPEFPDYVNDLNAMHEAEKQLTKKQLQTYLDFLADAPRDCVHQTWSGSVFTTARQRAEAFLRTIGKWEGGPQ